MFYHHELQFPAVIKVNEAFNLAELSRETPVSLHPCSAWIPTWDVSEAAAWFRSVQQATGSLDGGRLCDGR